MCLQCRANFVGRYIEMRMRRAQLSMRTEDIASVKFFLATALDTAGRCSVDANCFENGAKQIRFRLKTG